MLSTTISSYLGRERARDLRRSARRADGKAPAALSGVTIRVAANADHEALVRLAILDSRPVPSGHVLVAEVEGELRAALSVSGGQAVADPFHPTAPLVSLLAQHAKQVRAGEVGLGRRAGRHHLVPVATR